MGYSDFLRATTENMKVPVHLGPAGLRINRNVIFQSLLAAIARVPETRLKRAQMAESSLNKYRPENGVAPLRSAHRSKPIPFRGFSSAFSRLAFHGENNAQYKHGPEKSSLYSEIYNSYYEPIEG